jgi:hypothetical protein
VNDAIALQRLGQLADFRDQLPPADVRVVGKRLVSYCDGLKHAAARYLTARPYPAMAGAMSAWRSARAHIADLYAAL